MAADVASVKDDIPVEGNTPTAEDIAILDESFSDEDDSVADEDCRGKEDDAPVDDDDASVESGVVAEDDPTGAKEMAVDSIISGEESSTVEELRGVGGRIDVDDPGKDEGSVTDPELPAWSDDTKVLEDID